jgi:hypothetical protein
VQFEDYTCDSSPEVCEIQSIRPKLDKARREEEAAEYKATFLDALKGLEAASKYMCQFDTGNNITVMHNEDENEFLQTESSRKKEMRDSY